MRIFIELGILLACILLGARSGGISIGTISGIGLLIFVMVFRMPPGGPPGNVLGMIIAVITAVSAMQAAGGLDFLIGIAAKFLRRRPRQITLLAPAITYALVFAAGTQHVLYALLPVIAEVARQSGVRPERPLSASVVASQCGVIASPIAAATVAFAGLLSGTSVGLSQILMVTVPATIVGLALATWSVAFRGRELSEDPEYQRRLSDGRIAIPAPAPELAGVERHRALGSCLVFMAAVAVVVAIGLIPSARPVYATVVEGVTETGQVEMGRLIMIVMLAAAGVITLAFGARPDAIIKTGTMKGGVVALISILGVSWLGSSFIEANQSAIVSGISAEIQMHPWVFAAGMFALSVLLFSRAAAVATLVPMGLALGLPAYVLLGSFTAANGTFFLPTYGTVLAAVSFDQTGTTRIGKFLLDHSFMRPGLVATVSATAVATLLASWLFV